ncbi:MULTISPECIES: hypothetical protein [Enterobacteriaceae]|uniref:hypothetical protein n=1 Tax=Enterobacteriaceae TaxID=543 RepID=UPI000272B57A|nr:MULTISPECIES: hypothetical protein [Enterobacteriaceae]EJF31380.1 hypothetical protein A936_09391 [Enterobacter sp. Ag1]
MLPEHFLPRRYPVVAPSTLPAEAENSTTSEVVQDKILTLEKNILSGSHYAGQAKNRLLEETDRHIKERLLCAVRIEALHALIGELVEKELISAADLQMLIEDKTAWVGSKEQEIWVNQMTQEKPWPLCYSIEE